MNLSDNLISNCCQIIGEGDHENKKQRVYRLWVNRFGSKKTKDISKKAGERKDCT